MCRFALFGSSPSGELDLVGGLAREFACGLVWWIEAQLWRFAIDQFR